MIVNAVEMRHVQENDIRLIRQRLAHLENGRAKKAQKILDYLTKERGLKLEDVPLRELSDKRLALLRVKNTFKGEMVTLLVRDSAKKLGREPIRRAPVDLKDRELSWMEKCGDAHGGSGPEFVPEELKDAAI